MTSQKTAAEETKGGRESSWAGLRFTLCLRSNTTSFPGSSLLYEVAQNQCWSAGARYQQNKHARSKIRKMATRGGSRGTCDSLVYNYRFKFMLFDLKW